MNQQNQNRPGQQRPVDTALAGQRVTQAQHRHLQVLALCILEGRHADQVGLRPLAAELAKIDAITSASAALDVAFGLHEIGVNAFSQAEPRLDAVRLIILQ